MFTFAPLAISSSEVLILFFRIHMDGLLIWLIRFDTVLHCKSWYRAWHVTHCITLYIEITKKCHCTLCIAFLFLFAVWTQWKQRFSIILAVVVKIFLLTFLYLNLYSIICKPLIAFELHGWLCYFGNELHLVHIRMYSDHDYISEIWIIG